MKRVNRPKSECLLSFSSIFFLQFSGCGGPEPAPLAEDESGLSSPGWVGSGEYLIERGCSSPGCDRERHPFSDEFLYDDWAFERASHATGYFQVWQPGVTDRNNPNLWRELDVRLNYRVGPTGDFAWKWVNVLDRVGNNARYSFSLRDLDPFVAPSRGGRVSITDPGDCPTFPFHVADGGALEATLEFFVSVNGTELRPAAGGVFRGRYATSMTTGSVCSPTETRQVNKTGRDISVLQAWFGDRVAASSTGPSLGFNTFDPSLCDGTDCTAPVKALLRLPGATQDSPFVNQFIYMGMNSGLCELIEIRTVLRETALNAATFAGVGFWFKGTYGFVPKAELHSVGAVVLNDGSPAVVHRFLAQGMCFGQGGNGGTIAYRSFQFKPYARFDAAAARTEFRVWDAVPENYLLGKTLDSNYLFVDRFDRQRELLKP